MSLLRILALWIGLVGFIPGIVFAEECTHLWIASLDINPPTPKLFSGDTYAAYGLFSFYDTPNLRLEMKGDFFRGRFMSFESYKTKQKRQYDALYDYQIEPDEGSENPFRPGVPLETPNRAYTVHVVPTGSGFYGENILKVSSATRVHSIFFRAYAPNDGVEVTGEDLPRIFAYDLKTGQPAPCPKTLNTAFDPGALAFFLDLIGRQTVLTFQDGWFWNGTNHAIPTYAYALNRMKSGDVSVVRFRAPTFVDTTSGEGPFIDVGDVRYWSFCIQDLKKSLTLGCIPDYLAKVDPEGFATIVVGRGEEVRQRAEAKGFTFLEDRRSPQQQVMGFFYRNLFPKPGFPRYQGDYMPIGVTCERKQFLAGECGY